MKYLKLFEQQLDLFDGEYREDAFKFIHKKIDQFLKSVDSDDIIKTVYSETYPKDDTPYINNPLKFADFINADLVQDLYVTMFEKFVDYIDEIFKKSNIKLSKKKTDAIGLNIKHKDLYKMYAEHDSKKVINDYIVGYYKKVLNDNPTLYKELRNKLPDWILDHFQDLEDNYRKYVIEYYTKLFDEEPTEYSKIRDKLPEWVLAEFPDKERGIKANLWDFQN